MKQIPRVQLQTSKFSEHTLNYKSQHSNEWKFRNVFNLSIAITYLLYKLHRSQFREDYRNWSHSQVCEIKRIKYLTKTTANKRSRNNFNSVVQSWRNQLCNPTRSRIALPNFQIRSSPDTLSGSVGANTPKIIPSWSRALLPSLN